MGAYHGRDSFEPFGHRERIATRSTRSDPRLAYPPYTRLKTPLLQHLH